MRIHAILVVMALAPCAVASDFEVVINEINYNPLSGNDDDEFVELFNNGGKAVDLSGWGFVEGIRLLVPEGVVLAPKSAILVSPNPQHARARYGAAVVPAPFEGRLDNGGEIITLVNAAGRVIGRVRWEDGGIWPSSTDGLGPTLELRDPIARPDLPESWAASLTIDGTPGAPNSVLGINPLPEPPEETVLIANDAVWRYLKGTREYPDGWRELGFADDDWESGPTGIGYGDDDDRTPLLDMQGNYVSFAARRTFTVDAATLESAAELLLAVRFDDGFVAYLNGVEVARDTLGAPGTPVPFDANAEGGHEADEEEFFTISPALLREGENVLAAQVHNADVGSSDLSFIPRLVARALAPPPPGETSERPSVTINEVGPTEPGSPGFIELHNGDSRSIRLDGYQIVGSAGERATIGAATIGAGDFLLISEAALGFEVRLAQTTYALVEPDGATFVDGFDPSPGPFGETGFSSGRFPDGDNDGFVMTSPTPGASNTVDLESAVVVNEIFFHPRFVPPDAACSSECSDREQWIELHNRGATRVDLRDWSLTRAVDFEFPEGAAIEPGGFLVVAASRTGFLELYPGVDPAIVLGNWRRSLAHDSESVNLRDRLGNLVDHVRYGDGQPLNDEDRNLAGPCRQNSDAIDGDGVDDGTFLGSEWPTEADGSGRTIELVNPALDNRFGGSWRAGPIGGTPGAPNDSLDVSPPPVVGSVSHSPAVPRSVDTVRITCRISSAVPIDRVRVLWHRDGEASVSAIDMLDDGLSGDGAAGDGTFGALVAPQPNRTIVAFRIEAQSTAGERTLVPPAPRVAPYGGFEGPFYLYQVFDTPLPVNGAPSVLLVMTGADARELEDRCLFSNVLLPGTFIAIESDGSTAVRHVAGVRYRGAATRDSNPRSFKVEFPPDRPYRGAEKINLNSQDAENEVLAGDLFRRAGLPGPQSRLVNVVFRGSDPNRRYALKEHLDEAFLTRYFGGGSDGGNLYRAFDPNGDPRDGNLSYFGEDPDEYRLYYAKRSNSEEDDFSDLIELCRTFDRTETPDEVFVERLEALVDVTQWASFFAVQACLTNRDGGIHSGTGEDYLLYHVPADSGRLNAGKWVLVPWDIEETFTNADERLFRPTVPAIRRFLEHPQYATFYYCELLKLREGAFSRREMRQRYRLIDSVFDFSTIDGLDSYVTARLGFLDENVPTRVTSGSDGASIVAARLVQEGEIWRYMKGTAEPAGAALAWTRLAYDDSEWLEGASGIGYADGDDATVLEDMEDGYTTVYARRVFTVTNTAAIRDLTLSIDYDDGFVAYLNGVEIARREVDGTVGARVPFDAVASGLREAGSPEAIDVTEFRGLLAAGDNVLAVQGLNRSIDSSDFSMIPELLTGGQVTGSVGCGGLVYTTEGEVLLSGRSHACDTAAVLVDGVPATWDPVRAQWALIVPVDPGTNVVSIEARDLFGRTIDTLQVRVERLPGGVVEIGGRVAANAVISASGGPYNVTEDIVVPAGVTLTIESGATLFLGPDVSILVDGRLEALGTEGSPIVFRAETCADRWGGIALQDTGTGPDDPTHVLRHCDFSLGDNPAGASGFLAPEGSKLLVEGCVFRDLSANAIDAIDSRLEVRDSLFERIREGVHGTRSTVIVSGCVFDGMIGDRDAIDFDGDGTERSLIEDCVFMNGSDDGIDLGRNSVDILGNVFFNIQDKALSLEENGTMGPPMVVGNIIYECGTGMALKNGVTVLDGSHNTLVGNQEGINLFSKDGDPDGGHGVFHSMIVWNNTIDVKLDALSSIELTFSDVSGGGWPGEGNISLDPLFVDADAGDFSLRDGSPCIGAGLGGSDMGAVPSGNAPTFVRGDFDGDGRVGLNDAIATLDLLFRRGAQPTCQDAVDANDDGEIDISDAVRSLIYQFAGGPPLPAPFPDPGPDPTRDRLTCGQ